MCKSVTEVGEEFEPSVEAGQVSLKVRLLSLPNAFVVWAETDMLIRDGSHRLSAR